MQKLQGWTWIRELKSFRRLDSQNPFYSLSIGSKTKNNDGKKASQLGRLPRDLLISFLFSSVARHRKSLRDEFSIIFCNRSDVCSHIRRLLTSSDTKYKIERRRRERRLFVGSREDWTTRDTQSARKVSPALLWTWLHYHNQQLLRGSFREMRVDRNWLHPTLPRLLRHSTVYLNSEIKTNRNVLSPQKNQSKCSDADKKGGKMSKVSVTRYFRRVSSKFVNLNWSETEFKLQVELLEKCVWIISTCDPNCTNAFGFYVLLIIKMEIHFQANKYLSAARKSSKFSAFQVFKVSRSILDQSAFTVLFIYECINPVFGISQPEVSTQGLEGALISFADLIVHGMVWTFFRAICLINAGHVWSWNVQKTSTFSSLRVTITKFIDTTSELEF